jgi:hypothetical protein
MYENNGIDNADCDELARTELNSGGVGLAPEALGKVTWAAYSSNDSLGLVNSGLSKLRMTLHGLFLRIRRSGCTLVRYAGLCLEWAVGWSYFCSHRSTNRGLVSPHPCPSTHCSLSLRINQTSRYCIIKPVEQLVRMPMQLDRLPSDPLYTLEKSHSTLKSIFV